MSHFTGQYLGKRALDESWSQNLYPNKKHFSQDRSLALDGSAEPDNNEDTHDNQSPGPRSSPDTRNDTPQTHPPSHQRSRSHRTPSTPPHSPLTQSSSSSSDHHTQQNQEEEANTPERRRIIAPPQSDSDAWSDILEEAPLPHIWPGGMAAAYRTVYSTEEVPFIADTDDSEEEEGEEGEEEGDEEGEEGGEEEGASQRPEVATTVAERSRHRPASLSPPPAHQVEPPSPPPHTNPAQPGNFKGAARPSPPLFGFVPLGTLRAPSSVGTASRISPPRLRGREGSPVDAVSTEIEISTSGVGTSPSNLPPNVASKSPNAPNNNNIISPKTSSPLSTALKSPDWPSVTTPPPGMRSRGRDQGRRAGDARPRPRPAVPAPASQARRPRRGLKDDKPPPSKYRGRITRFRAREAAAGGGA
ncbi:MAG: hypothetical protein Q9220_007681 [cf. Caloplaca sp. 1 TL-2023]